MNNIRFLRAVLWPSLRPYFSSPSRLVRLPVWAVRLLRMYGLRGLRDVLVQRAAMNGMSYVLGANENFDEQAYLRANPDVAAAVEKDAELSGRAHFEKHGDKERRLLIVPVLDESKGATNVDDFRIVATESNFDEEQYLLHNEDVAAAVRRGEYKTGREHFDEFGHAEERAIGFDYSSYESSEGLSTPIPPVELIYLVTGKRDPRAFDISRRSAVVVITELLKGAGVDYKRFRCILDFGCGCGRVLAGWEHVLPKDAALHGCDINKDLIAFCQKHIGFAETVVSGYYPPLPYADGQFDLVHAVSVYAHLKLASAQQWTGELSRIIKPGGVAIITYHGSYYAPNLAHISKAGSQQLAERGYYVHLHGSVDETWEGSNYYATYFTSDFLRNMFSGFDVLRIYPGISHGPTPLVAYQDIMVLQRAEH